MRIHAVLLAAFLFPAGAPGRAAPPGGDPARPPEEPAKVPPATADAGGKVTEGTGGERDDAHPWPIDSEHTFLWTYDGRRVGETRFRMIDLARAPRPGAGAARWLVETTFEYRRDTSSHRMTRSLFYGPDWTCLRYHSETHLRHAPGVTSHQECQGWIEGSRLISVAVHNHREDRKVRSELPLPERADLLLPHGVEMWAVLLAGRVRDGRIPPARVAYPDFGQVYAVEFTPQGKESVDLPGGAGVPCAHFRFSSPEKQLHGEVWLDDAGKLVRYRQGPLVVQLVESREKAGDEKPAGAPSPK